MPGQFAGLVGHVSFRTIQFYVGLIHTAVAGGLRILVDHSHSASEAKRDYIAQNFDSTDSQVFVMCATSLSTTASNVRGTITWREIR